MDRATNTTTNDGGTDMDTPKNADDAKGRLKEAAGSITGDQDLKDEGKVDRATGGVKDAVDTAADKVKDIFGKH